LERYPPAEWQDDLNEKFIVPSASKKPVNQLLFLVKIIGSNTGIFNKLHTLCN
jgi:hypothetical protein